MNSFFSTIKCFNFLRADHERKACEGGASENLFSKCENLTILGFEKESDFCSDDVLILNLICLCLVIIAEYSCIKCSYNIKTTFWIIFYCIKIKIWSFLLMDDNLFSKYILCFISTKYKIRFAKAGTIVLLPLSCWLRLSNFTPKITAKVTI